MASVVAISLLLLSSSALATIFVVPYLNVLTLSRQSEVVPDRSDEEVRMLYLEWRAKHHHSQKSRDLDEYRFEVFKENLRFVDEHDTTANRGEHTFRLAMNQFADLTNEEYLKDFSRLRRSTSQKFSSRRRLREGDDLLDSIDWSSRMSFAHCSRAASASEELKTGGSKIILSAQPTLDWASTPHCCFMFIFSFALKETSHQPPLAHPFPFHDL
ncbi:hypothetical protein ZIOFF_015252 [Zingiber officinale]|uniref:Cathepsin propeptide inhibitor domain-containing protein n=1 Tax=Zingiber officinale TaxID=94328 RepID=A0A8J5HII2_ZINOF|nr:hypothetical protein ZIOFF_015252 [Zingiber officinale]